ncbi:dTDP-4-dehydrorhamnose reductase [Sulfuricurvum sp.]|uniref:dTDP-4-dehydrorhamnose reductase n=1 Tax=Sulfuricurvum sp. TaxID=2025608 RepID=UPI00262BB86C|nr:dTDP-4-dehydrorhamnose reductase [Sulfuricurvum sp.]MDD2781604.1 dTDP-4-dehydrorhamnose reductase [Sulfuricurvum sp.]
MFNVLVTGANGQLGSEIHSLITHTPLPEYHFHFATRKELDLSNLCKMEDFFDGKKFDAIINCAAYTAVDKAESESELADTINHRFVSMLAKIAKRDSSKLIHISTDYVFDGKNHRPYIESDPTDPQGVYGRSKCDGENAILSVACEHAIIIRTSWVYSSSGANFVKTMLRLGKERDSLGVIFDQVGTPTYARDLAQAILDILPQINNTKPEIYHYSNEGAASWYDFAKAIFELSGVECRVNPITTDQYPTPASRPHYSLLNKSKIKNDFNLSIPYWRDALKECLTTLGETK